MRVNQNHRRQAQEMPIQTQSRKFAPGELVRPKRGGPAMRVDHYGDFDFVHCTWLDEKSNPQSKPFPESWLEKISLTPKQIASKIS